MHMISFFFFSVLYDNVNVNRFLSPCRIHLGGIITEGYMKGFLELTPAQYNVVLEDDTYRGMIKVGLKFIATVSMLVPNPVD